MKSPACTQNKWGTGTDASKEMKARLAAVMAERDRQDCMWTVAEPKKEVEIVVFKSSTTVPKK